MDSKDSGVKTMRQKPWLEDKFDAVVEWIILKLLAL